MVVLHGVVQKGVGDFGRRFKKYGHIFRRATGEDLFAGTINVKVDIEVSPIEHFRVIGAEIDEPQQDLLFEVCRINGVWGYRIRPYHLSTGWGGHGDDTLEIASSQEVPNVSHGSMVAVALFRDSAA